VTVILASLITFVAFVARSPHERIGLAGRPSDQYDPVSMVLADLRQARVNLRGGTSGAEFEFHGFMTGPLPFLGKQRTPVGLWNLAVEKTVVFRRKAAAKLTEKASKPKGLECGVLLLDREHNAKRARAVLVADTRKSLG
jgi:hypothetical protein